MRLQPLIKPTSNTSFSDDKAKQSMYLYIYWSI